MDWTKSKGSWYSFKTSSGDSLNLLAKNNDLAKKSAKEWESWLHKEGRGSDKVYLNSIKRIK